MRCIDEGSAIKKTFNHPKADPEKRSLFCGKMREIEKSNTPIVYIDESGFDYDMPRTHGYSMKRQGCYGKHDGGAKGRTNAIRAWVGKAIIAIGL